MKTIRLAMLVAAMFVGTATVASAQGGRPGGRGGMVTMALQGITLTAAQQSKVDSINAKYREEMTKLRSEGGDQEAMRTKGRELTSKQIEEVKAVLTDDQKKQFDKNIEEARARMQRPPSQ